MFASVVGMCHKVPVLSEMAVLLQFLQLLTSWFVACVTGAAPICAMFVCSQMLMCSQCRVGGFLCI